MDENEQPGAWRGISDQLLEHKIKAFILERFGGREVNQAMKEEFVELLENFSNETMLDFEVERAPDGLILSRARPRDFHQA